MNHGTERNRKRYEAMTPGQRAAVDAVRARHKDPAYRAEEARVRESARVEFPPKGTPVEAAEAFAALRLARESRGLSLADVQERTGIDRGTISKLERGELANPTVGTLQTYARALGKRLVWSLADAEG